MMTDLLIARAMVFAPPRRRSVRRRRPGRLPLLRRLLMLATSPPLPQPGR